ncbi:extracellular solute-binding protein [Pelagibius sp. CAU 1746]|uniref:ABC transporter substrate-binding protein n=1 Tax=Pelagibius sp. CAU 1746 TaxID=3140370 RepID=UPI00325C14B0
MIRDRASIGSIVALTLFCLLFPAPAKSQGAGPAAAGGLESQLIVLTSFPETMFSAFREAFEAAHPGTTLHFLNRKTSAAITYIQESPTRQVDVVWASAPDAFEVLKESGHLTPWSGSREDYPSEIAGYPLDDPDGFYYGFALSGYGILWNSDYLNKHGLPTPKSWIDLLAPIYRGHIGVSAPSRSGTMHIIVETFLQTYGWQQGWAHLLQLSGNLATVTARSFGVRDGVRAGRFGLGLAIDFFGLSLRAQGHPVDFVYPPGTPLIPANIAIVTGAEHPKAAAAFLTFVRSVAGQELLFLPQISRLPASPSAYSKAPASHPHPFDNGLADGGLLFDSDLSRQRYHLVNALFDRLITFRLRTLTEAWERFHVLGKRVDTAERPDLQARLDEARRLLTALPVTEAEALNPAFSGQFVRRQPGLSVPETQVAAEGAWEAFARKNHADAMALLDEISEALR